jgi:exodeoxyribonuclease VII small subunit
MPQKQPAPDHSTQTFETAIERLERIVEEMEGDKLPLEQLLERYEEGSNLIKVCQEKLETAERRVELLMKGGGGKLQAVPFDPNSAASPAAPAPNPPAPKKSATTADVSLF